MGNAVGMEVGIIDGALEGKSVKNVGELVGTAVVGTSEGTLLGT